MKALSLIQPWASMIADGLKTIETRTWRTHHRGPILIVASKSLPLAERRRAERLGYDPKRLSRGVMICTAQLLDCVPFRPEHQAAARVEFIEGERRFAWMLGDIRRVEHRAVKGNRCLFNVPDDQIVYLEAAR